MKLFGPLALAGSLVGALACGAASEDPPAGRAAGTWSVVADDAGERPIEAIRVVREVTGLGLRDAKDLVDGVPSVIRVDLSHQEARDVAARLEEAGMKVELRGP